MHNIDSHNIEKLEDRCNVFEKLIVELHDKIHHLQVELNTLQLTMNDLMDEK